MTRASQTGGLGGCRALHIGPGWAIPAWGIGEGGFAGPRPRQCGGAWPGDGLVRSGSAESLSACLGGWVGLSAFLERWELPSAGLAAAGQAAVGRCSASRGQRWPPAHWPQPLASSTPTKASFIRSSSWAKAQLPSLLVRLTGVQAALQSGVAARGCSQAAAAAAPLPPSSLPWAAMAARLLGGSAASGETLSTASCTVREDETGEGRGAWLEIVWPG